MTTGIRSREALATAEAEAAATAAAARRAAVVENGRPPTPEGERWFLISHDLMQRIADYIGNAPSGQVPVGLAIRIVGELQALKPAEGVLKT
jgi:hypothetical protein